jgi:hypothetical protein
VIVQVELDLPAHSSSWRGQYDFAWCAPEPNTPGVPGGGMPNAMLSSTYKTLGDLYGELAPLLATSTDGADNLIIHLGGDEVGGYGGGRGLRMRDGGGGTD